MSTPSLTTQSAIQLMVMYGDIACATACGTYVTEFRDDVIRVALNKPVLKSPEAYAFFELDEFVESFEQFSWVPYRHRRAS